MAGMGASGLTSVWKVPRTSPAFTLTAPISVIDESGPVPVVSRSTTTKVASGRKVPRSSNDGCTASRWLDMLGTLIRATDNSVEPAETSFRPTCCIWFENSLNSA